MHRQASEPAAPSATAYLHAQFPSGADLGAEDEAKAHKEEEEMHGDKHSQFKRTKVGAESSKGKGVGWKGRAAAQLFQSFFKRGTGEEAHQLERHLHGDFCLLPFQTKRARLFGFARGPPLGASLSAR